MASGFFNAMKIKEKEKYEHRKQKALAEMQL